MLSCGMLHQLKNNFMYADDCEREHSKSEEASREHTHRFRCLYIIKTSLHCIKTSLHIIRYVYFIHL